MAHRLDRQSGIRVRSVAAGEEALLTEPASAAANRERDNDAITFFQGANVGADLDDLAHVLVAQDIAAFHSRLISIKEVQIRAANRAGGDLNNHVARVLN